MSQVCFLAQLERSNTSIYTMELVRKKGNAPRFPFEQFCACEKIYQQLEEKVCWKDSDSLRSYAATIDEPMARIVGYIDAETAKQWLDWNLGELLAVAFLGGVLFCIPGGTVVVY